MRCLEMTCMASYPLIHNPYLLRFFFCNKIIYIVVVVGDVDKWITCQFEDF
jgi:hypothetical protein